MIALHSAADGPDSDDGDDEPRTGRWNAFSGREGWALVGRAAVVLAVVAGIAWAMRPRYNFVVTSAGGRVTVRGRMPANLRAAAVEFFERDFPPAARCKVLGRYRGNRTLQLNFRGVRSPGDRQRIRNVLSVNR